ncbi:MAG: S-adenosylmethionine:tRNA ribosyltransferase-isomerase [Bacteroidales bacterium]|nr:S-adenosylmethionine:tRNA ribosyltransferase-isomerase [Bacteroidales bacterium]
MINLDLSKYTYVLPDERIAKYPLPDRSSSKLLVFGADGSITDHVFREIPGLLPSGALLVRNDTKVIRARLRFAKESGAKIEIFCLEPAGGVDVQIAFTEHEQTEWKCIVGNSKRWKSGDLSLSIGEGDKVVTLTATRVRQDGETSVVRFCWTGGESFAEVMTRTGEMPIPPYLNRKTEAIDETRYQTVYSCHDGSVAAPTAGLHFTNEVLDEVRAKGHEIANVTLHVGAGTFKPISAKSIEEHVMHTEHIVVTLDALRKIREKMGNIVAVGTTSVRTLESLYWLGVKLLAGQDISNGLSQWEAYDLPQDKSATEAFDALIGYVEHQGDDFLRSQTQILIVPPYKMRVINALITNFHQPDSTLLLLVAAIVGEGWHDIYDHALANGYRFLSYGDSSLLMPRA